MPRVDSHVARATQLTVVLTLAVGIGATTSIFSAVNALLLRPLPYPHPDELMKLSLVAPGRGSVGGTDDMVWSYPKYVQMRNTQRSFSRVSAYASVDFTITSGETERIHGESITSQYFPVLGVRPVLGQTFDADIDAHGGARRDVIISDVLWKRRFNADPHVVGQTIEIDRDPFTIIGVAPRDLPDSRARPRCSFRSRRVRRTSSRRRCRTSSRSSRGAVLA